MKDLHRHVEGIPVLSKTKFNDLTHCATCMKANLTKAAAVTLVYKILLLIPIKACILTLVSLEEFLKTQKGTLENQVELI